ncbi:ATP-binding protein [Streptomyces sp. NPDC002994]|uniref:ATP-binding protein n=1 Tax=Streptomyces sp. NPDC002994 TaxID=3154441 RepID=UPI0033A2CFC0
MDPGTVPPDLPSPSVLDPVGMTAAQVLWQLADHHALSTGDTTDVFRALGALDDTITVVVPDVDLAGPVRCGGESRRLVNDLLRPLAATANVRLLVELPRPLIPALAEGLPQGLVQVIDLDEPEYADPEGLALQAETALDPALGFPALPFALDPDARRSVAEAISRRASTSPLVVQLTTRCMAMAPEGFDPTDEQQLPSSVAESIDLHALRLGTDPATLRVLLAPLALAEGDGLPVELWGRLVQAVAGRDMSEAMATGMPLAGPFLQPSESEGESGRTLLRLLHPAIGDAIRAGLPNVRATQSQIAMALLQSVPDQDWSKADAYVRDHIAGHTLEAGLLPQLLTDPSLFVHANPVVLRSALESVPADTLGLPALTYLRTSPLLTRTDAPSWLRAGLLETAFVEDGLPEYAAAVHRLDVDLPWETLWSLPVRDVHAVTVGSLSSPKGGQSTPVAVLAVPANTPGARPIGENAASAVLIHGLIHPSPLSEADPDQIVRPSEEERAEAPLALSRGGDYLRVWSRASEEVVASMISDVPFTAADLSPDGILLIATERGAKALRIRKSPSAIAS